MTANRSIAVYPVQNHEMFIIRKSETSSFNFHFQIGGIILSNRTIERGDYV